VSSPTTEVRAFLCCSLLVLSTSLASACGHVGGYHAPPAPLLERAFVAPSLDARDSLLYEAQIATNVFLVDQLLDRVQSLRDDTGSTERVADRLVVVPMFRIRQLKDSSAAVRTPSFMPSVFFERHYLRADTVRRTSNSAKRELRAVVDEGYRLGWTHHSNGQAGCFLAGYVSDSSGDPDKCTAGPRADTTGVRLNRASGDFSTTYWSGTLFKRWLSVGEDQTERSAKEVAVGYQLHRFGIFGDMRPQQRALYGSHRLRLDASYRRRIGPLQGRVDALAEIAEHTDRRITRWRAHVDLSVRFPSLLGTGAMVRFLDGQDYYNIGFANRRSRVLFGLVLDPSRLESPR
jgi:hypothetical protein